MWPIEINHKGAFEEMVFAADSSWVWLWMMILVEFSSHKNSPQWMYQWHILFRFMNIAKKNQKKNRILGNKMKEEMGEKNKCWAISGCIRYAE